jgi:hypothetical protein
MSQRQARAVAAHNNCHNCDWTTRFTAQLCGNLVVVAGCLSYNHGSVYVSAGGGLGIPGVAVDAGAPVGTSPSHLLTGWSTTWDANFYVGGAGTLSDSGGGGAFFEVGSPGDGQFTTHGWKLF